MLKSFSSFWDKHGFSTLVILTIIFFLLYWLFFTRHNPHGSYSTTYYYDPKTSKMSVTVTPNSRRWEDDDRSSTSSSQSSQRSGTRRITQTSKGETICKNYLEYLFERPFQKVRPSFLYNSVTHDNLELDMYNEDLNLACEFNGRQHYEYVPFLHANSRVNFHNQKYRDKEKRQLCEKYGVRLITVPYTIPPEKIPAYLKQEVSRLGIPCRR